METNTCRAGLSAANQIMSGGNNVHIDRPDLIANTIAKVDEAVCRLAQIQSCLRRRHCTPSPCPSPSPAVTGLPLPSPSHDLVSHQIRSKVSADQNMSNNAVHKKFASPTYYPFLLHPDRNSPSTSTVGISNGGRISKARRRWTMPEETVFVSAQSTQSSTATTVDADSDKFGEDGKENFASGENLAPEKDKKKARMLMRKKINEEKIERIIRRMKPCDVAQQNTARPAHITPHGEASTTSPTMEKLTYVKERRVLMENKAVNASATTKEASSSWNVSDFQKLPIIHLRMQKGVDVAVGSDDGTEECHGARDGESRFKTSETMARSKPAQTKSARTDTYIKIINEDNQKSSKLQAYPGRKWSSRDSIVSDPERFPNKPRDDQSKDDRNCAINLRVIQRPILSAGATTTDNRQNTEETSVQKHSSNIRSFSEREIHVDDVAERFTLKVRLDDPRTDLEVERPSSPPSATAVPSPSLTVAESSGKQSPVKNVLSYNQRHNGSTKGAVLSGLDQQKYRPPWRDITAISNKRSITAMTIAERVMSIVTHQRSGQIVMDQTPTAQLKDINISKKTTSIVKKNKKRKIPSREEESGEEGERNKKPSNIDDLLAMVGVRSKRIPSSISAEKDAAMACNRVVAGACAPRSECHNIHHDQKLAGNAFCVDVRPSPTRPWRLSSKSSSSAKPLVMFPNPTFKASDLYNHTGYGALSDPGNSRRLDIKRSSHMNTKPFKIFQIPPLIKTSKTNIEQDRLDESDDQQKAENSSTSSSLDHPNNADNLSFITSVSSNSRGTSASAICDTTGASITGRRCESNSENTRKRNLAKQKEKSKSWLERLLDLRLSANSDSRDRLSTPDSASIHRLMKRVSLLLPSRRELEEDTTSLPSLITRLPRRRNVIKNNEFSVLHNSPSNCAEPPNHTCITSSLASGIAAPLADTPLPLPPSLRGKNIVQAANSSDHGHIPSVSMMDKGGGGETLYDVSGSLCNLEQMQQTHGEEGTCYSRTQDDWIEKKETDKLNRHHVLQGCYWWRNGSGKKKKKKRKRRRK